MNINSFNQYTVMSRTILLKNDKEALASLQQLSQAATQVPTSTEVMREVEQPMKKINDAIKNSWVI